MNIHIEIMEEYMMQNELLIETQQSYYDYVVKLQDGCQQIANSLRAGEQSQAYQMIANLSEGIEWMITVEKYMFDNFFRINSRLKEVIDKLSDLNVALEVNDFMEAANLFEKEICPMFVSASEWTFEKMKQ